MHDAKPFGALWNVEKHENPPSSDEQLIAIVAWFAAVSVTPNAAPKPVPSVRIARSK
jgi:hypothetical protein